MRTRNLAVAAIQRRRFPSSFDVRRVVHDPASCQVCKSGLPAMKHGLCDACLCSLDVTGKLIDDALADNDDDDQDDDDDDQEERADGRETTGQG